MRDSEIIERIKNLEISIDKALLEMGNMQNQAFYKSLLQQNAIELYNLAALLGRDIPEFGKPEIQITRQDELFEENIAGNGSEPEAKTKVTSGSVVLNHVIIPKAPEPEKEIRIEPVKISVGSTSNEADEDLTINERISKSKQPVVNIAEKLKETPIRDISKAVSISKKFEFINGLFDGNSEAYKSCLNSIQSAGNYENAVAFIESNVANNFDWQNKEKLALDFFSLVRRRFSD